MERLTKYLASGAADYNYPADCYSGNDCNDRVAKSAYRQTCVERLAAYEDTAFGVAAERLRELAEADKDGRVVVLPCKIGDTVWAILDGKKHVCKCIVEFINIGGLCTTVVLCKVNGSREQYGATAASFSKTVFLTREEAENALEAMKND